MKEIGGYFQLEQLINKPYYKNLVDLNTGRNALLYLIKAKNIKKIYLPFYLCKSLPDMLIKYQIDYEFYKIGKNFLPLFDKILKDDEYLYIVNYYGQVFDSVIIKLKEQYNNIIMDNTQSFFQRPIVDIDTIYSCRKFFGVPDGAYLSTNQTWDKKIEIDKSNFRMDHLLGRFEGKASDYYNEFKKNDESFKELPLRTMSNLTKNILGAIDYDNVIRSRDSNFNFLHSNLMSTNVININCSIGPFAYPYYVENGIEIRKRLAKNKIYIATLWPNVLHENQEGSVEYNFAANILPLPCDQRYEINDMRILLEELKQCIN